PLLIWWTPLCLIRQILTRRFRLYAYSDTNLLALDDPAMAQTVAIELRNSDRSRLALGEASPTEEVDANGNVTLNFFANYRALASGVRPGVAKADAIFMINYN
ncbi:fimbrial protein, partial [Escherichia coli]